MNCSTDFIENESKILQKQKSEWIEHRIKSGGNKKVINFIADILFHGTRGVSTEDSIETIRCLFEAGYCYHFAKLLEDAFPNGQICLCYPFGHIVYVYEGVAYDINGVSDAEYEMYIPIEKMEDAILDFKHIPGVQSKLTKDKIQTIIEQHKQNKTYINAISAYDQEIVDRSRAVCELTPEPKYEQCKTNYINTKNKIKNWLLSGFITNAQFEYYMNKECEKLGISYPLVKSIQKEKEESA